jgi:hypothetical protein
MIRLRLDNSPPVASGFIIPESQGSSTLMGPGPSTAILAGKNGGVGIGLLEIYYLR